MKLQQQENQKQSSQKQFQFQLQKQHNNLTTQQQQYPQQVQVYSFNCGGQEFTVDKRYEYIKQVGGGAYGIVASALDKKTQQKVAIKKVFDAFEDLVDAKRILREIKLLRFFDHENIVSLVDIPRPPSRTGYKDIYIITELMETDLHRVIYSRQDLTDEHIQYFIYQILKGLLQIHNANVIHRDLKPSNILVNKNCLVKICDLGLARGFEQEDENKTEYVVTRWYRAPEVILQASEYTKAVDIWSVGCIFAELLGRTPLFPGNDYLEQIQRTIAVLGTPTQEDQSFITNSGALKYIKSLPKRTKQNLKNLYTKSCKEGLDLLEKMLAFNPNHRLNVQECIQHPYFKDLFSEEDLESTLKNSNNKGPKLFDWSWDNFELKKETIQSMVDDEAISYTKFLQQQKVLQQKKQQ